jgi:hypothetical protein
MELSKFVDRLGHHVLTTRVSRKFHDKTVLGNTTAERRATMFSDPFHTKARSREGKALDPSGERLS